MTFYFGRSVPRDIGRTKLPITEKLTPCTICCLPVFQWEIVLIVFYKKISIRGFCRGLCKIQLMAAAQERKGCTPGGIQV